MIAIEINNRQQMVALDEARLSEAVRRVLGEAGIGAGEVSLAVVADAEIHELNRRHLDHDCATDVISFVYAADVGAFEGEIIVSAETAVRQAKEFNWSPGDELLLYVVHGALHLAGYDDVDAPDRQKMREMERRHLEFWKLSPRFDEECV